MIAWVGLLIAVLFAGGAALACWLRAPGLGARSRVDGATSILDGLVALALARAVVPWAELGALLWFGPVLLLAAAAAGLAWTWPQRPTLRADRPARRALAGSALHAVIGLALLLFFLS